jgi:hypothetical protein
MHKAECRMQNAKGISGCAALRDSVTISEKTSLPDGVAGPLLHYAFCIVHLSSR